MDGGVVCEAQVTSGALRMDRGIPVVLLKSG